jgi:hypothetical protein
MAGLLERILLPHFCALVSFRPRFPRHAEYQDL